MLYNYYAEINFNLMHIWCNAVLHSIYALIGSNMFVWIGCDISHKFIEYREKVRECNADLNASENSFKFPQHISLKITFETEDEIAKHCIKDIVEMLKATKSFTAKTKELELHDGIIWIRMEENEHFRFLHDELDQIAISYAVKQHEFDKNFIFHSTVVMDEDREKLEKLFERVKDIPYPEELKINTFLVGHSFDNIDFKIDRRIKVK